MTAPARKPEDLIGSRVEVLPTSTRRRFPADFPGWGTPNAHEHLLDPTPGLQGTITSVDYHGHNPWTRYCVRYDDGSHDSSLVLDRDIQLV